MPMMMASYNDQNDSLYMEYTVTWKKTSMIGLYMAHILSHLMISRPAQFVVGPAETEADPERGRRVGQPLG
jgi:hypothetical protein